MRKLLLYAFFLFVNARNLAAMGLLDGCDYVLMICEHLFELMMFDKLLFYFIIFGLQLCEDGEKALDGGDELQERIGEVFFFLIDKIIGFQDGL